MNKWFKTSNINIKNFIENIRGYVLPHTGTVVHGII